MQPAREAARKDREAVQHWSNLHRQMNLQLTIHRDALHLAVAAIAQVDLQECTRADDVAAVAAAMVAGQPDAGRQVQAPLTLCIPGSDDQTLRW